MFLSLSGKNDFPTASNVQWWRATVALNNYFNTNSCSRKALKRCCGTKVQEALRANQSHIWQDCIFLESTCGCLVMLNFPFLPIIWWLCASGRWRWKSLIAGFSILWCSRISAFVWLFSTESILSCTRIRGHISTAPTCSKVRFLKILKTFPNQASAASSSTFSPEWGLFWQGLVFHFHRTVLSFQVCLPDLLSSSRATTTTSTTTAITSTHTITLSWPTTKPN